MDTQSAWKPYVQLELDTIGTAAFEEAICKFVEWAKQHPAEPLKFSNGWYVIEPQTAENMLTHNRQNRKVSLATVRTYARRMREGEWKKTGQPILITDEGDIFDCQHRLWACYLSGHSFETFVVADVPHQVELFAYIDGGKPRNAADALYTAGSNGLSGQIASAIKIAYRYDNNGLGIMKQPSMRSLDNIEVIRYEQAHPDLNKAAHLVAANYPRALSVIGSRGVGVFVAWKIIELYGIDVLDEFFQPLGSGAHLDEDDPILHLRNRLMGFTEGEDELNQPRKLALVIRAFNMHRKGESVHPKRGLFLRDNERFPRFDPPVGA